MAIELATAYISLTTSARGIGDSVTRELGGVRTAADRVGNDSGRAIAGGITAGSHQAAGGFKSAMTGLAGVAAGAFATDQIAAFFSSAVDEAKESAKVNALTAQVIKTTGAAAGISADQVGALATKISNYAGVDDEAVQAGENLLLTFTNVKNGVGAGNDIFSQATAIMSDMSVALGQDTKSSAIQLGKALNDPIKGVTALQRVGVSFTAAQKDQIKALVESGNTMGAQKLILAELGKEFGGAAEAAASPSQKLTVAWGNFKEQVGTALLPLIGKFATVMTEDVIPALSGTIGFLDRYSAIIGPIAGVVGVLVGAWATYVAVTKIATAVQAAFNVVMALNPVTLIVIAIIAFIAALVLAYNKVGWFRDGVNAALSWIKDTALAVWHGIADGAVWLWNALKTAWDAIGNAIQWVWTNVVKPVGDFFVAVWHAIGEGANWLKSNVIDPLVAAFTTGFNFVSNILRSFAALWVWLSNQVIGLLWTNVIKPVWDAIRAGTAAVVSAVAGAWQWLWTTILSPLWNAIKTNTQVLVNAVGAAWQWLYNTVLLPVWNGIKAGVTAVGNVFKWLYANAIKPAVDAVAGAASWLWDRLRSAFDSVMGKVRSVGDTVRGVFNNVKGYIIGAFDGVVGTVRSAINGLISLINGAVGGINHLVDAANNVPGVNFPHLPSIPHLARGGLLGAGWNLVGENGPELAFKAGSSVRVFSNSASQDLVGAGGRQLSVGNLVHFSGPVHVRSDQDILELSRGIARESSRRLRALGIGVSLSGASA